VGTMMILIRMGVPCTLTEKSQISLDKSSFMFNKANNYDGSIYIRESILDIKGGSSRSDGSVFSNNIAHVGGAIKAIESTVTAEKGSIIFNHNLHWVL
jgi:hypothetical protein